MPYTFVFIEDKKEAPSIAAAYRKALLDAPALMRTPPSQNGDVFFGNDAFEQWGNMLEGDFYQMKPEEFNSIRQWRYYCVYICIIATNIFTKQHTTDRAIKMNPELAGLSALLDKEYKVLDKLENRLKEAGGDFNVSYEVLQDSEKRKKIACILREFPKVYRRICDIIEQCQ